ncbi:MAG: permease [bacterium]
MSERRKLIYILLAFLAAYFLPVSWPRFQGSVHESLALVKWYAREHVLLCLVPAFLIAGAIGVFVSQASVLKYFGAGARKVVAYGVASVSGSILAVCSCTVLPLFSGIYTRGAGLGPAVAFLYSGPAINVLAIILTARVLGLEMGIARAVGAVSFSVIIGLLMHFLFLKEELARTDRGEIAVGKVAEESRPLWKNGVYFFSMVAVLVFLNWGSPQQAEGLWSAIYKAKWAISAAFLLPLAYMVTSWFKRDELSEWMAASWGFAKQILPLLLAGVAVAGFLLGRPGHEGLIPSEWVSRLVGGNSPQANLFASVVGAFMYFATLTEVPILEGLIGAGMGKGPALALLLAGPALSLPSMLVINSIIGPRKTIAYCTLVVVMATVTGLVYGALF